MSGILLEVYKCKNCGAIITQNAKLNRFTTEWILNDIFETGFNFTDVRNSAILSGKDMGVLHRCDPENLSICDFIGWRKKKKDEEKHDESL